jgi:hypothetical protein
MLTNLTAPLFALPFSSLLIALCLTASPTRAKQTEIRAEAGANAGKVLMQRSEAQTKSRTEVSQYRMDLIDADGSLIQSRTMRFYFKRQDKAENTLLRFDAPAALQGTGLLVVDKGLQANDLWLYLPATRRLRRLAGAEKTNRFLGTEFTHEDFEDYKIEHYSFAAPQAVACGSAQCFTVTAQAESEEERAASGYGSKVFWLERESLYPVRIDYLDRAGQVIKRLEARGLARDGKYWRPAELEMLNLTNKRRTLMVVQKRALDIALDDEAVSQRGLRSE